MRFLLDTSVFLEATGREPNPGVLAWLAEVEEDDSFISVVTVSELRHRSEMFRTMEQRRDLEMWLRNGLSCRFAGRVLTIDAEIAHACGRISALSESMCRPLELRSALIAATAEIYGLTLVTRHALDFENIVKDILTPWAEPVKLEAKQKTRRGLAPWAKRRPALECYRASKHCSTQD
jgi:predicted nucleic acid-binding protein